LCEIYETGINFLAEKFRETVAGNRPEQHCRAYYPEVRITCSSFAHVDSRLSFGHLPSPGTFSTTVTRPDLFANYLRQQIGLLVDNHGVPVRIGASETPIPVHFAVASEDGLNVPHEGALDFPLRNVFDVPDLSTTNDAIVNGMGVKHPDGSGALAPFTAQRVDYSLARLTG
jgi:AMP nucleosidase